MVFVRGRFDLSWDLGLMWGGLVGDLSVLNGCWGDVDFYHFVISILEM